MTAKDLVLFGASLQRIAGLRFGPIVQWFRSSGTQNAYSSGIGSPYGQASITTFSSLLMSPPSLVSRHRCRAEAKAASRRRTEGNIFSQPDRFAAPSTKRSRLFLIARGVHICRVPIGGATSTLGNPGGAVSERGREMRTDRRSWRWLIPLLCSGALAGCSLFKPLPKTTTVEQRLAMLPTEHLPLQGRVTVYWDEHQIPFIDAETDDDAAFALGLVHAHLRLGQMAIYRRIAQGRIAEMGGPLAIDIDHGIRILDFARATPASLAAMPEATRRWLQRFVDGVNHYQATAKRLPFEYRILGLEREPWTVGGRAHLRPPGRRRRHLDRLVQPAEAARPARLAAAVGAPAGPGRRSLYPGNRRQRTFGGRHGRHPRRTEPVGQQQPRHRAQPHAHRRGHSRQRSAPRHQSAEYLAARRREVAVVPRGRD